MFPILLLLVLTVVSARYPLTTNPVPPSSTNSSSIVWTFRRLIDIDLSPFSRETFDHLNATDTTPSSDLRNASKSVVVVTTASLPWMTGTAVNPLLRASYLAKKRSATAGVCTLAVPFIDDLPTQRKLYKNATFSNKREQESYLRNWLDSCGEYSSPDSLRIVFYPAVYDPFLKSIFPLGDVPSLLNNSSSVDKNTICILEEPEHLNWYRAPGPSWREKFAYVVGICHTNYKAYASAYGVVTGVTTGTAIAQMSALTSRAHCDRIILLSEALPNFASERTIVCNVHGVREEFFREEGDIAAVDEDKSEMIYFIGKLLWAKGLDLMLELQTSFRKIKYVALAVNWHRVV